MKLVLTPDWFLGNDVLIEVFSFLVLLAFFILCIRYYKLSNKKNIKFLGIGFLLIAVAQLSTILTKLVLYYDTSFTQQIGQMVVTYNVVHSVDIFYELGFFLFKLLTLAGLYMIYRLPEKKASLSEALLGIYFLIISAVLGASINFMFHITVLVLLILIIDNYYKIYKENRSRNTLTLIGAFVLLALAHLVFTFSCQMSFVIGNIVELVSYLILLFLMIKILRCDKISLEKIKKGKK